MCFRKIIAIYITLCVRLALPELRDFKICHEDFNLKPPDGLLKEYTFPWLGLVQYIHMTTGHLHHNKAPRVVLIHTEFVIGTAMDLLHQPKGYKLGHIVFGEYERDEKDCGLTHDDIKSGARCPRASLEISIRHISPHPEFSRFGAGNSVVLVKLFRSMKSNYILPVCLPSRSERLKKKSNKVIYLIDYMSSVPRDFDSEKMAKKTLKLYTHRECTRHRKKADLGSEGVAQVLCSSGCGVRPGAPIISQSTEGRFELLGLAVGGAPCSHKSMRRKLNPEPPMYIDLYPYSSWIINVITAHRIPKPYPENFKVIEGSHMGLSKLSHRRSSRRPSKGWKGRMYVVGDMCFKSLNERKQQSSFFYAEQFHVRFGPPTKISVEILIRAGDECRIVCARLIMPNRVVKPKVKGIETSNITVKIDTQWFPYNFIFVMGLSGENTTEHHDTKNENNKGGNDNKGGQDYKDNDNDYQDYEEP